MKDEHLREKIIEIIGFGMERERAECKTDEILALIEEQETKPLMTAEEYLELWLGDNMNTETLKWKAIAEFAEDYHKSKLKEI